MMIVVATFSAFPVLFELKGAEKSPFQFASIQQILKDVGWDTPAPNPATVGLSMRGGRSVSSMTNWQPTRLAVRHGKTSGCNSLFGQACTDRNHSQRYMG